MTVSNTQTPVRIASFSEEEINLLLDFLTAHKLDLFKDYYKNKDLSPFPRTKTELWNQLEENLTSGKIEADDLIKLLDGIEGWGNQHAYFYTAPQYAINFWRNQERVTKLIEQKGFIDLLNKPKPLVLPDGVNLSSIEWNNETVKFIWVGKHRYETPYPAGNYEEGGILYKAFLIKYKRRLTVFEMDLLSGHAMLMIQSMPLTRQLSYKDIRDQILIVLRLNFGIDDLDRVLVSRAIWEINQLSDVRKRQVGYGTALGKAQFWTTDKTRGIEEDTDLRNANAALGSNRSGWVGDFYWSIDGDERIHTKIYARDQHVWFPRQQTEQDVRYVVSQIRRFST